MPPPPLPCPFVKGWIFILSTSSLTEGSCAFSDKLDFALMEEWSQCLVGLSVVREGALSRISAVYGVETGGFLPATIAMAHSTN